MKRNLLYLIVCCLFSVGVYAQNEKPFVIPELKEWKGAKGEFVLDGQTCISCLGNDTVLHHVASAFSTDYEQMFRTRLTVSQDKAKNGDIVFQLCKDKQLGEEGV